MHPFEFFSAQGAYVVRDDKPLHARVQFVVPDVPSAAECGAALELAGRLAFESLFVPEDPAYSWCGNDARLLERRRVVIGEAKDWLREQVPDNARDFLNRLATLVAGQGLLGVCRVKDDAPVFMVAGADATGLLGAARALAASNLSADSVSPDRIRNNCHVVVVDGISDRGVRPAAEAAIESASRSALPAGAGGSLHRITEIPGLYERTEDGCDRMLTGRLHLRSGGRAMFHAAMRILAPLCQNGGAIRLPLTHVAGVDEASAGFAVHPGVEDSAHTLRLNLQESGLTVSLPAALTAGVRNAWSELFAPLPVRAQVPWRDRIDDLSGVPADRALRAWASYLLAESHGTPGFPGSPGFHGSPETRDASILTDDPDLTWEWQDPGEAAEILALLDKALFAFANRGLNVDGESSGGEEREAVGPSQAPHSLEIFTTVSEATRMGIRQAAEKRSDMLGLDVAVTIRSAHKSGLHWLMQDVLPEIRACAGVVAMRISARRFADTHPGVRSDAGGALDRPLRYLQEMYPADALLSRELGIGVERVLLELRDCGPMFRVEGLDGAGVAMETWSLEGWSEQRAYLPCCPGSGQVCVSMAGIRAAQGNSVIAQYPVMTDAERMWKWYGEVVLPSLKEALAAGTGGHKFQRLEIHVWEDCVDTPIVGLETSSVGEALAEDLYFNTLDAMRRFGKETGDSSWASPGAVVPFVHERAGSGPAAVVSVQAMRQTGEVMVAKDGMPSRLSVSWPADRMVLHAREAVFSNGEWQVRLGGAGWSRAELATLERWVATPLADAERPETREKDFANEVLYPEDVESIMSQTPDTVVLEQSYDGIPIWLGECYETLPGYTTSRVKQALWKPTLFINARHHANEVSSTNSALLLMREFLSGARTLERVNVVLIPLQNVDGARTHAALCEEHPTWMHHAARYNACGDEFARDYFNPASPYGESRTYGRVWERWRPDVFLDDHGIPSHEWVQPFAGYGSPPTFPVSYWIPQARMYTIWRRVTGRDAGGQAYQRRLEEHVASYIQGHEAVSAANARLLKRYERWGHQFDPVYFPLTLTHGTLTFVHEANANPESRNPIIRYPQSVTAELVTETDDETVVGAHLEERVEAHRVVHRALLDWLTATPQPLRLARAIAEDGKTTLRIERPRPLAGAR